MSDFDEVSLFLVFLGGATLAGVLFDEAHDTVAGSTYLGANFCCPVLTRIVVRVSICGPKSALHAACACVFAHFTRLFMIMCLHAL